jgi:hypothetical protein
LKVDGAFLRTVRRADLLMVTFITENQTRASATEELQKSVRTADAILMAEASTTRSQFDIFLSHSVKDAQIVLRVMRVLEGL